MPAGVDWIPYLKFLTAGMLSMMAGAQVVHVYYKPMTISETPPQQGELGQLRDEARQKEEERNKVKEAR